MSLLQLLAFTAIGALYGPIGVVWYRYLERWFPGTSVIAVAKKLVVDEVAWGPLFTFIMFYILPLAETLDNRSAMHELKTKFVNAWLGSAAFWVIFQSVNFRYIPMRYRVIYLMGVSFFYDTFIAIYRYQY